jgi:hypothetical protein
MQVRELMSAPVATCRSTDHLDMPARLMSSARSATAGAHAEYLASIEAHRAGEAYHVPGEFVAVVGRKAG